MAYVYRKSQQSCEEVFKAMLSRGFMGEMRLSGSQGLGRMDWLAGAALLGLWFLLIIL